MHETFEVTKLVFFYMYMKKAEKVKNIMIPLNKFLHCIRVLNILQIKVYVLSYMYNNSTKNYLF